MAYLSQDEFQDRWTWKIWSFDCFSLHNGVEHFGSVWGNRRQFPSWPDRGSRSLDGDRLGASRDRCAAMSNLARFKLAQLEQGLQGSGQTGDTVSERRNRHNGEQHGGSPIVVHTALPR